jgi:hypothetical protein
MLQRAMSQALAMFLLVTALGGASFAQSAEEKKSADGKQTNVKPEPPRRAGAKNASGVLDLTFDDLKFDIEKGAKFDRKMLPQKIEDYKGKKITIRGYILPSSVFQREGIKVFILVRDDKECCFGPMAAIYDCMRIEMEGNAIATFTTRPITVEGEFDIREWAVIDGRPMAIYHMKATSAK